MKSAINHGSKLHIDGDPEFCKAHAEHQNTFASAPAPPTQPNEKDLIINTGIVGGMHYSTLQGTRCWPKSAGTERAQALWIEKSRHRPDKGRGSLYPKVGHPLSICLVVVREGNGEAPFTVHPKWQNPPMTTHMPTAHLNDGDPRNSTCRTSPLTLRETSATALCSMVGASSLDTETPK